MMAPGPEQLNRGPEIEAGSRDPGESETREEWGEPWPTVERAMLR
jgi:hypothetical protein